MARASRLVELYHRACALAGPEREAFVEAVREEDAELGSSLADLLRRPGPLPTEPGSFAERLRERYGSETDPHVSLEGDAEGSNFASEIVQRLAGRGRSYGRYELRGEIARGGQGAILRVWDEDLRRSLAMKVVLERGEVPEGKTPGVDSRTLGRFLEEAQVTGQLDHPGIVPVHELGLDDSGRVYFTMKLVKGEDLKSILDRVHAAEEDWTRTRALNVLLKVCEAMAYAHSKGVIHRDLKPSNVMVGKFGEVYVMDWGLARVLGREDAKDLRIRPQTTTSELFSERRAKAGETPDSPLITMDGDVVGTPAYMSPEQARGDLEAMGPHSDVYAAGALLYHLLTGEMPYLPSGARLSNYAIWALVQKGPPDPVHELATGVPPELAAICEKAMERDVSRRYPDMAALAEDLRAYLEGRVVRAYESGAWAEARKWIRRNRLLAASLAALVLALAGGQAVAIVLKRQSDRNFEVAEDRRVEAEARAADVLRLSALQDVEDLFGVADRLWPPYPEKIGELEDFQDRAEKLISKLPDHRAKLEEVRRLAEREKTEWERRQEELLGKSGIPELERYEPIEYDGQRYLKDSEGQRFQGQLTQGEARWWSQQLTKLVDGLEHLESELLASDAVSIEHGWSIPKRLAFARRLERGFAEGGEFQRAWVEALPGIREVYRLELEHQMGLVPIGPDPTTGLWEFGHLPSGEVMERDAASELVVTKEAGMVFVLLPSGLGPEAVREGAISLSALGLHFGSDDAGKTLYQLSEKTIGAVTSKEVPDADLEVDAFFLSKFELTQTQWRRIAGSEPSLITGYQESDPTGTALHRVDFSGGFKDLLLDLRRKRSSNQQQGLHRTETHPVERVSYDDCLFHLRRLGLRLPSPAEWMYAAGGFEHIAASEGNTADSFAFDQGAEKEGLFSFEGEQWRELDDGYVYHAPVGSLAANEYGLSDMLGNVWEWVTGGQLDLYRMTDGEAAQAFGGSFARPANNTRELFRVDERRGDLGLRPARAITGEIRTVREQRK